MTEKWGLAVAGPLFLFFTDTVTVRACLNGYGNL